MYVSLLCMSVWDLQAIDYFNLYRTSRLLILLKSHRRRGIPLIGFS
jgi:hypothetical protein